MKDLPEERTILAAEYIIENGATVRSAAKKFGVSKSTVHKDLVTKLRYINPNLYSEVKKVLETNKAERHLRGGEATKRKYKNM
jgi:putative DeoR family transcriptional regulator (stage III sporulation protein D)